MEEREAMRGGLSEALRNLEPFLSRLPGPVARPVREKLDDLRRLLLDQRAPRLAIVGRRGAGKSSLINAFFGAPRRPVGHEHAQTGRGCWTSVRWPEGTIELLDTRGFQEGSRPAEDDPAATAIESVSRAVREKTPDAILFVAKATEVDAAIDRDLDDLDRICDVVAKTNGARPPLLAVLTHCDDVEPRDVRLHAPEREDARDVAEKRARIERLELALANKIRERERLAAQLVHVAGVCSYQSWREDGSLRADARWRVDELVTYLARELPKEAQVELARLARVRKLQRTVAGTLVQLVAGLCAAIATNPLPVADIALLTPLQGAMLAAVAYISGRELGVKAAAEFTAAMGVNVGAAVAFREIARALVRVVPGFGSIVSAGIAYVGTVSLGRAAIAYFVDGASAQAARELMEEARAEAARDFERRPPASG